MSTSDDPQTTPVPTSAPAPMTTPVAAPVATPVPTPVAAPAATPVRTPPLAPVPAATRRAPWASVTACPDGPLLVRGDVEILLASGRPADRRRSTVALCRCGASGIKPFCDGSHKVVGFRTDDEPS